ncbi:MAG: DNA-deoxyinosine glycosylase [Planctomycetes bacterium]|nr:DNA-deoxyinosine glycosylase [Planctomycetota bacterium]
MDRVESFAPIASRRARILVLGSMPGVRSLAAGQYYAHPQNAFWPIVGAICGFDPQASYGRRTQALRRAGIALWDVLQSCERAGSLDSAIVGATVRVNDFAGFLRVHRKVQVVLCNGATAHAEFERRARPLLTELGREIPSVRLPSTSPANASMSRAAKLAIWQRELGVRLA